MTKANPTAANETWATRIAEALAGLADPAKAAGMRAYMKDRFAFLGVHTPLRRRATATLVADFAGAPLAAAAELWRRPEREYQYVACDLLASHAGRLTAADLEPLLALARRKSWWDTVDALAKVAGGLVARQAHLAARMDALIDDPDPWLRRVALLHQLGRKGGTDTARLFAYCLRRAGDGDFFIRKAIGWALRDYAWHDPGAVADFLARHGASLSALSRREAAKNLPGGSGV